MRYGYEKYYCAILTLIKRNNFELVDAKQQDFKEYIKNLFADSFHLLDNFGREYYWYENFSYIGSQTETPDIILRNGDAIEVKGILSKKNITSEILLNNVPPLQFLQQDDILISERCRQILKMENQFRKDVIYVVGTLEKNRIRNLVMVYGRDYCAANSYYNNIRDGIKKLYENAEPIQNNSPDVRELANIKKLDPLGLTSARLNAYWKIKNPWQAFSEIYQSPQNFTFDFMCIINWDKWQQLGNTDKLFAVKRRFTNFDFSPIVIKNPDNKKERNAFLITYKISETENQQKF